MQAILKIIYIFPLKTLKEHLKPQNEIFRHKRKLDYIKLFCNREF